MSPSPTDWLGALAAFLVALMAIHGFRKWMIEHAGKERYIAAKELMASVYLYRDSLKYTRNPLRQLDDYPEDFKLEDKSEAESPELGASEAERQAAFQAMLARLAREDVLGHTAVFNTRFTKAGDTFKNVQEALSRAEVVLGDATPDLTPLYVMHSEIHEAWSAERYRLFVVANYPPEEQEREIKERERGRHGREWPHQRDQAPDEFDKMLDSEVRIIRNGLTHFLPLP